MNNNMVIPVSLNEMFRLTFNSAAVALIYTGLGALVSFFLYHIFDEYDDEWKKKSTFYKFRDVILELCILAFVAFWSSYIIIVLPPILHVRQALDTLTDNYSSNMFYMFAVFIFLDDLAEKLKYIYVENLGPFFENLLPKYGSITNLTLSYSSRKTEDNKFTDNSHQWTVGTHL